MHQLVIEVCVDSLLSAQEAVAGGADRLEICGSLASGGGVTPSAGLVLAIKDAFPVTPLMIMVRPRTGDFVYSGSEVLVMQHDIEVFKRIGVMGVVLGVLNSHSNIDISATKRLVDIAYPLEVTFHRAFDMGQSFHRNFMDLRGIPGITRVLTSGMSPSLISGLQTLCEEYGQVETPAKLPVVMPGSGISPATIVDIVTAMWPLGCHEFHLSGGRFVEGKTTDIARASKKEMGMGRWQLWVTDREVVRNTRRLAIEAKRELEDAA